jgi:hypothetical protein
LTTVEDYLPQGRPIAETGPGHEADVLLVRRLVQSAAALVGVILVVTAILSFVMNGFSHDEKRLRSLTPPQFAEDAAHPAGPALQPRPSEELAGLREHEQRQLNNYGWVDRDKGVAHIPIARAIEILANTGLPAPAAGPLETTRPGTGEPAPKTKPAREHAPEGKP